MGRKAKYVDGLRVCTVCKVPKPEDQFAFRSGKESNWRLTRCKPCEAQRHRGRWNGRRQWLNDYKLTRGCVDCGYDKHPAALDFDHLPGTTKTAGVGLMAGGYSMVRIMEEIAKCEVVCANCHRIRTAERRSNGAVVDS